MHACSLADLYHLSLSQPGASPLSAISSRQESRPLEQTPEARAAPLNPSINKIPAQRSDAERGGGGGRGGGLPFSEKLTKSKSPHSTGAASEAQGARLADTGHPSGAHAGAEWPGPGEAPHVSRDAVGEPGHHTGSHPRAILATEKQRPQGASEGKSRSWALADYGREPELSGGGSRGGLAGEDAAWALAAGGAREAAGAGQAVPLALQEAGSRSRS